MDMANVMADQDTCTHFKAKVLFRVMTRASIAFCKHCIFSHDNRANVCGASNTACHALRWTLEDAEMNSIGLCP